MNAPGSKLRSIAAVLSLVVLSTQLAYAAHMPKVKAAQVQAAARSSARHVPAQIAAAHKIYLTNTGADPNFPIDSGRAYNALYDDLEAWGHYQLVNSAADADLVFQLHSVAPVTGEGGTPDDGYYSVTSPAFQLTLIDPATNTPIWTITSPVNVAGSGKTYDRWVDIAVTNLVSRVKVLAGESLSTAESNDLTSVPPNHHALGFILLGGLLVVGIGGGFLAKHEFDKDVQKQNATLCAQNPFFCTNP